MATLYQYVHCPFCIRVRMAAGFLGVKYDSVVLPYDDEETPLKLMNKKMLPIFDFGDNISNESLEIVEMLDTENKLWDYKNDRGKVNDLNAYLNTLGGPVHSAAMPYFIYTPEFNESSRKYFLEKKEAKRGPFHLLAQNQSKHVDKLNEQLDLLENNLEPFYCSDKLSLLDVLLASHLWGMYMVPEFQFSSKMHQYLQAVKKECKFNYHEDFWRNPL